MGDDVLCTVAGSVGHVVLNRPAALNALNLDMVRGIHAALREWQDDGRVAAVLFRGAGERGLCAGGDIRALYESCRTGGALHGAFFAEEYALDVAIHRYRKPRVAIMDGVVLGGGMGISQGATRRIVTERTRLGMPEVSIGFFPDVGGSYFLSRLPGRLGTYLALTGVQIRAADALYCGLADRFLPAAGLASLIARLSDPAGAGGGGAGDPLVALVDAATTQDLPDPPLARFRAAIDQHFALPTVPAIVTSLENERRPPFETWARETLAILAQRSPMMMCVTLEQLRRGALLSLEQCFEMELRLALAACRHGDFLEGVRASIIDKDGRPQWRPPRLEDVRPQDVASFFAA